jgi:hypothetical protein
MSVSGLTAAGDWRFGQGKAVYIKRSDEIAQNVVTRIRSFTNDWFPDVNDGLAWFEMLGSKGQRARILRELEQTVLRTEGVRTIEKLDIADLTARNATIEISYRDIFDRRLTRSVSVP